MIQRPAGPSKSAGLKNSTFLPYSSGHSTFSLLNVYYSKLRKVAVGRWNVLLKKHHKITKNNDTTWFGVQHSFARTNNWVIYQALQWVL